MVLERNYPPLPTITQSSELCSSFLSVRPSIHPPEAASRATYRDGHRRRRRPIAPTSPLGAAPTPPFPRWPILLRQCLHPPILTLDEKKATPKSSGAA